MTGRLLAKKRNGACALLVGLKERPGGPGMGWAKGFESAQENKRAEPNRGRMPKLKREEIQLKFEFRSLRKFETHT